MTPRKVVGSVDTSEFLVALAASLGFLFSLGRAGLVADAVVGLLVGGMVAAPLAAWLVRLVTPRLLGVGVGGLIVLTNARTLALEAGISAEQRTLVYVGIVVLWGALLAAALAHRRREGADAWSGGEEIERVRVSVGDH